MQRTFRLTLLAALLVILAACSTPPEPTGPRGLRAVAGPDFVQLYWDVANTSADHRVEYRRVDTAGEWADARPALLDAATGTALAYMPAEGDYEYRVGVWHNDLVFWSTAPGVLSPHDGVKLQVGTFNRGDHDAAAGTVFIVWLDLPADVSLAGPMLLSGPAGWAAGEHPVDVNPADLAAGYLLGYLYDLEALPGTYTVTATDTAGTVWSNSIEFEDSDFRLAPPAGLTVDASDPAAGTLSASWTPPVAGAVAQVSLFSAGAYADGHHHTTAGSSYDFTGTGDLTEPGLTLEVVASNALLEDSPRVMPVPFGVANTRLVLEPAD